MSEPLPHQHVVLIVAIAVAAIAALSDWRRGEIPNWLTYGALALGPILHAGRMLVAHETMEAALTEGGFSIVGALVAALVPALLYRQGAIGGGDLKLLACLGAILQTMLGVEAEMYGFFAAALIAPARLAYDGKLIATLKNAFTILANLFLPKTKQRHVEETALSWFRLGPPLFFGVALTAYLHW
ncbi:MAG TPA: A24 family peptidase [Labilithrix sp.]|jgi:prepilin peptidase CpaA|nr:A24 family peptidase [Labilithrix sp.]